MITRSKRPPECSDPFLKSCAEAFRRRGKAIRYRGALEFTYALNEAQEWFTAVWWFASYPTVKLQLVEGGEIGLWLISRRAKDRGRVILRLEGMRALPNDEAIVAAFECIISDSRGEDSERMEDIKRSWSEVTISALD